MKALFSTALLSITLGTSIAQAQQGPSAAGLPFSDRAFNCGAYKSSELDSMSQLDLEETYCSYRVSVRLEAKREVEYKVGYAKDPENFEEVLKFSRRLQQQCTREIKKTINVLSRRFPGPVPNCSIMWKAVSKQAAQGGTV
jgi:hypothetical protein